MTDIKTASSQQLKYPLVWTNITKRQKTVGVIMTTKEFAAPGEEFKHTIALWHYSLALSAFLINVYLFIFKLNI